MKARRIDKVTLYNENAAETLDIREIAEYLEGKLKEAEVEAKGNPFTFYPETSQDYAGKLASIRIQDVSREITFEHEPLYGEVRYEKERISGKTKGFGVVYDGFQLARVLMQLIPGEERKTGFVHILFTNRLFATWDDVNKRYHLRTSVYAIPSVISTTGIVEAPAKPREYYLLKQQYDRLGKDLTELKSSFEGRFIDYEDNRLTEVAKGYVMQAVFYSLTGEPFCEDKGCRLYNAHWQEELISAQLESKYEFCQRHARILSEEYKS